MKTTRPTCDRKTKAHLHRDTRKVTVGGVRCSHESCTECVDGVAAIEEGLARHSGLRPKNQQERTTDVDREERVLTKSVVTPELIVRGQHITLRREEVR